MAAPSEPPKPSTRDDDLAKRARRWVEETTRAQGVPATISDPATASGVRTLMRDVPSIQEKVLAAFTARLSDD
jgi:hypothetical protein